LGAGTAAAFVALVAAARAAFTAADELPTVGDDVELGALAAAVLVLQVSSRRRPSMKADLPLVWNFAKASPRLPKKVTSMKVGRSCHSPSADWKRSLTARPTLTTAVPLFVKRVSGSRVRLPIRMTRLKLAMGISS
jgi:hypothetical protein